MEFEAEGLIVDLFAGGGGASLGIENVYGRSPDIAVNHDPLALAMHAVNHPKTLHLVENVWKVRPQEIIKGRRVDLLWASPDCTHFSKAKGEAPNRDPNRARRSRGLAWVIWHWARHVRPTKIFMENVEEWIDWGPLASDGRPCPRRKGETRKRFIAKMKREGYKHKIFKSRASRFGVPTIRQRLFAIFTCDGEPINEPRPTHAPKAEIATDIFGAMLKPERTAAEIIEWNLPCPSIFTRHLFGKKDLAAATNRRIARGMKRYVIDAPSPFIVPITHQGDTRVHGLDEPLRTITTAPRGELALATPYLVGAAHGEGHGRGKADWPLDEPIRTVTASNDRALVSGFLAGAGGPSYGGKPRSVQGPMGTVQTENHTALVEPFLAGCGGRAAMSPERPVSKPVGTITGKADQVLVAPIVTVFRADNAGASIEEPLQTVTANSYIKRPGGAAPIGLSAAFLAKQYGGNETPGWPMDKPVSTITTQDHHHLVAAGIVKFKGTSQDGQAVDAPLDTVQAQGKHYGLSHAFLTKYYSEGGTDQDVQDPMHTLTAKARLSLVQTAAGSIPMTDEERMAAWWVARFVEDHLREPKPSEQLADAARKARKGKKARKHFTIIWTHTAELPGPREAFVCAAGIPIVDIGMRMLSLRELFRAQGFPDSYIIEPVVERVVRGKKVVGPLPKTDGTRMCGNSVCPGHAEAYLRANPIRPPQRARRAA